MKNTAAITKISAVFFLLAAVLLPESSWAGQTLVTLRRDPGILRGTSRNNYPLLFAPGQVALGSSVSHWDVSATPNLLMEPNISLDKPFGDLDLTPNVMEDIGWVRGNSTFNIIDLDDEGQGFTDPRPFAGAPGNEATTLGEARLNLVAGVLDAWGSTLQSPVDIDVLVTWVQLPCDAFGAILGGASTTLLFMDEVETTFPEKDTWFHSALAESLFGQNLSGNPEDGNGDIVVNLNSAIDDGCMSEETTFYYGLDGDEASGQIDLAPVILHELAHGLGFSNFVNEATGMSASGIPGIFDHFTFDETLNRNWVRMSNSERVFSATNDKNLVWRSSPTREAANGLLTPGTALLEIPEQGPLFVGVATDSSEITEVGTTGSLACAYDVMADAGPPALPSIRDACQPILNAEDVAGSLAIVDRGNCLFAEKAANLEAAGALAAIIINTFDVGLIPGGDFSEIGIPVVGLSRSQGDFLRSLACPTDPPASLTFAQWINGETGGHPNSVRVILRNLSPSEDTGTIQFRSPSGELLEPAGAAIAPIPYTLSPFGTFDVATPGTGPLQFGTLEVRSNLGGSSRLVGTEIFEVLGKPVSVQHSILGNNQQIYVSKNASESTAIALYNPDPEVWIRIELDLYGDAGSYVASNIIDLAPRQQIIGFIDEAQFFGAELAAYPEGFSGTLDVYNSIGLKFALLGLLQKLDGSLIAFETVHY